MKRNKKSKILRHLLVILSIIALILTFAMYIAYDYLGDKELTLYLAISLIITVASMLIVIFVGIKMMEKKINEKRDIPDE